MSQHRRGRWRGIAVLVALGSLVMGLNVALASVPEGQTVLVSQSTGGVYPNDDAYIEATSDDGERVAFTSMASNLILGDTNGTFDVFVHDVDTGATRRVNRTLSKEEPNGSTPFASLSGDGTTVAYYTFADNMVGDAFSAVFAVDVDSLDTTLISRTWDGEIADGMYPSVSDDGSRIAFTSPDWVLPALPSPVYSQIYLHDSTTDSTSLISVKLDGGGLDDLVGRPALSGNGMLVAFSTRGSGVTDDDLGFSSAEQIYIRDLWSNTTELVTKTQFGTAGNGDSINPSVSDSGRFVAYSSRATNLASAGSGLYMQVLVTDRLTDETWVASRSTDGQLANSDVSFDSVHISGNGSYVLFSTCATNLVPTAASGCYTYRHSVSTRTTELVSANSYGEPAGYLTRGRVDDSGNRVAFEGWVHNLVPPDPSAPTDRTYVFQRDLTKPGTPPPTSSTTSTTTPPPSSMPTSTTTTTKNTTSPSTSSTTTTTTTVPPSDESGFRDTTGHTFEDDIAWLADAGITRGCNPPANSLFCPDDDVTRGQMAAFLSRALNLPPASAMFTDSVGHVFQDDIAKLASQGITRGCNPPANDRFCPDDEISRGQMAAFLVRALALEAAPDQGLADIDGSVFANDINSLAFAGVTKGCNPPINDRFCPLDSVTRGQMAAFLHRALSR